MVLIQPLANLRKGLGFEAAERAELAKPSAGPAPELDPDEKQSQHLPWAFVRSFLALQFPLSK